MPRWIEIGVRDFQKVQQFTGSRRFETRAQIGKRLDKVKTWWDSTTWIWVTMQTYKGERSSNQDKIHGQTWCYELSGEESWIFSEDPKFERAQWWKGRGASKTLKVDKYSKRNDKWIGEKHS